MGWTAEGPAPVNIGWRRLGATAAAWSAGGWAPLPSAQPLMLLAAVWRQRHNFPLA
jgi:hypothetical protein